MKLERVVWSDATTQNGWVSWEDAKALELAEVTTVGYVAHEDENKLVLVQGFSGDEAVNAVVIPIRWIVERRDLK